MKYTLLLLLSLSLPALGSGYYYGHSRNGHCSMDLTTLKGELSSPTHAYQAQADFEFNLHGTIYRAEEIPGTYLTYRENGEVKLNEDYLIFRAADLNIWIHLIDGKPSSYEYLYDRHPNYIAFECHLTSMAQ